MQPGPSPSGSFICCGPMQIHHHIGLSIVKFLKCRFSIMPVPQCPGFDFTQILLTGLVILQFLAVIFLMQSLPAEGERLPIAIPIPSLTVTFSINISPVHSKLSSKGFGTTTSSKFWTVMLKIWKRAPEGSMPSVLKGNITRGPVAKCFTRLICAVVLTLMSKLQTVPSWHSSYLRWNWGEFLRMRSWTEVWLQLMKWSSIGLPFQSGRSCWLLWKRITHQWNPLPSILPPPVIYTQVHLLKEMKSSQNFCISGSLGHLDTLLDAINFPVIQMEMLCTFYTRIGIEQNFLFGILTTLSVYDLFACLIAYKIALWLAN